MTEITPTRGNVVTAPMPRARFETLIATYGAAPERWPDGDRAAAEALVERSAEARAALVDAAILDSLLESGAAPAPSDGMTDGLRRRYVEWRNASPWRRLFQTPWPAPWSRSISRFGIAFVGLAALIVAALALDRWAPDPATTASGPTLVRALPPIDGAPIDRRDNGFDDEDGPLESEIASIDPTVAFFADERSLEGPGSILAGGLAPDELPLD